MESGGAVKTDVKINADGDDYLYIADRIGNKIKEPSLTVTMVSGSSISSVTDFVVTAPLGTDSA